MQQLFSFVVDLIGLQYEKCCLCFAFSETHSVQRSSEGQRLHLNPAEPLDRLSMFPYGRYKESDSFAFCSWVKACK